MDNAGEWLRAQADSFNAAPFEKSVRAPRSEDTSWADPLRGAGPDPLDTPTDDQGRALAALDSGRWTVEPGTSALAAQAAAPARATRSAWCASCACATGSTPTARSPWSGTRALQRWLAPTDRGQSARARPRARARSGVRPRGPGAALRGCRRKSPLAFVLVAALAARRVVALAAGLSSALRLAVRVSCSRLVRPAWAAGLSRLVRAACVRLLRLCAFLPFVRSCAQATICRRWTS